MAKPGLQTISANNTFQVWLDRTNEIVEILQAEVLTASVLGDTAGTVSVPLSSTLVGSFTANNVTATTVLRANEISPLIGSLDISINAPIQVDTTTQTAITLNGTSGPRVLFNTGSVEWRIGFADTITNNFIIDTGVGTAKLTVTPTGGLVVPGSITATGGVSGNVTGNVTGNSSTATALSTGRTIGMTGDIVWTTPAFNGSANVTAIAEIQPNVIGNTKLRDSTGLSVIGRSASTLGDPGDIVAASDHQVLRRSGTSIGFGAIALNQPAAISGILPVSNGGTGGSTQLTARDGIGAAWRNTRVIAGTGLIGGGDISEDRTLSVSFATDQVAIAGTNSTTVMNPSTTLRSIRENAIKGYITFDGTTGAIIRSKNLTLTKVGTGDYLITCDASIRDGSSDWGVVVGSVDNGIFEQSVTTAPDALNIFSTAVTSRTSTGFTVRAKRNYNTAFQIPSDDANTVQHFGITAVDPSYIALVVF